MSEFEYWQVKSKKQKVDARLSALEFELTELLNEIEVVSDQSVKLEAKLARNYNESENQPWINVEERVWS